MQPRLVQTMLAHQTLEVACGPNHVIAVTAGDGEGIRPSFRKIVKGGQTLNVKNFRGATYRVGLGQPNSQGGARFWQGGGGGESPLK